MEPTDRIEDMGAVELASSLRRLSGAYPWVDGERARALALEAEILRRLQRLEQIEIEHEEDRLNG